MLPSSVSPSLPAFTCHNLRLCGGRHGWQFGLLYQPRVDDAAHFGVELGVSVERGVAVETVLDFGRGALHKIGFACFGPAFAIGAVVGGAGQVEFCGPMLQGVFGRDHVLFV